MTDFSSSVIASTTFVSAANRTCWYQDMWPVSSWFVSRQRYCISIKMLMKLLNRTHELPCLIVNISLCYLKADQRKNVHCFQHSYSKSSDLTHPLDQGNTGLFITSISQLDKYMNEYIWLMLIFYLAASKYTGPRFSVSPWIRPTRTPDIISPRSSFSAGPPKKTAGAMSPTYTTLRYSEQRTEIFTCLS